MRKHIKTIFIMGLLMAAFFTLSCNRHEILSKDERAWLDSKNREIAFSCDPGWAPYEFSDNDGNARGIAIDYLKIMEQRIGIKFKFVPSETWNDALNGLETGRFDFLPSIASTPARLEKMLITRSYYSIKTAIFTRSDFKTDITLKDLKGKRLGVVAGYALQAHLEEAAKDAGFIIVPVSDAQSGLMAVTSGNLDALAESIGVGIFHIKKLGVKNLRVAGYTGFAYNMSFGIRKESPMLLSIISKGIESIKEEDVDKLLSRWNRIEGDSSSDSFSYLHITVFLCISGLCLLIIIYAIKIKKAVSFKLPQITFSKTWAAFSGILVICIAAAAFGILFLRDYIPHSVSDEEKKWIDSSGTIKIGAYSSYPPYLFFDFSGEFRGVTADFLETIRAKYNLKYSFVRFENWNTMLDALKNGEIDIVPFLQETPERKTYANFTSPYIKNRCVIVCRKGANYKDLEDLKGKAVSATSGHAIVDHILNKHKEINIFESRSELDGLLKTSFGETEAMITTGAVASYLLAKEGISNLKISGETDYSYSLSFGIRKDKPELYFLMQKALTSISESKKNHIINKWMVTGKTSIFEEKGFWIAVAASSLAVSAVFLAVIMWNISLKKKVRERTMELEKALAEVKTLKGFLPVCSSCKKVRDDSGYWSELDLYISTHADVEITHSLCPDCVRTLYPDYANKK